MESSDTAEGMRAGVKGSNRTEGHAEAGHPSSEVVQDQPFWRLGIAAGVL